MELKLTFTIGNQYTTVRSNAGVPKQVPELCSVSYTSYFKKKGWAHPEVRTRKACYYDYYNHRFPSGWASMVIKGVQELLVGAEIEVVDARHKPAVPFTSWPWLENVTLREYQKEAVLTCHHVGRGIVRHPTGAGKTITAARLISELGLRSLYMVPNKLLLNQTYEELCKLIGKDLVGKINRKLL